MSKVIKNGTVCTADRAWKADVLIEGEVIRQIGENLTGDEYIDAEGAYVIPGGIDPHTHLEMPFMGTTAAETFETGTWAAAAGGTTMVVDFCLPGEDGSIKNAINEWHRKSAPQICSDVGYHMAITGWDENVFNEMEDAVKMGVNSFKHFMAYKGALMIEDDEMFASFKRCRELGALPMVHAENGNLVADLQAGRAPDPEYGRIAKLRSTHNNYLTLPVVFLMLSNHYPLAFATEYAWIIAALVFLMGVTIRHYFNSLHARKGNPTWTWAATVILFLIIAWLSTAALWQDDGEEVAMGRAAERFAAAPGFDEVTDIVTGRCSMCHGAEPVWAGIARAPKGVLLETPAQIARAAREIYLQAGVSRAMPPANLTDLPDSDRRAIIDWYRGAGGMLAASARP